MTALKLQSISHGVEALPNAPHSSRAVSYDSNCIR